MAPRKKLLETTLNIKMSKTQALHNAILRAKEKHAEKKEFTHNDTSNVRHHEQLATNLDVKVC